MTYPKRSPHSPRRGRAGSHAKIVEILSNRVRKIDSVDPAGHGRVAKQTRRLLDLGRRGYCVPRVLEQDVTDDGRTWAEHGLIVGPTLAVCLAHGMSRVQEDALGALVEMMVRDRWYIDLEPSNLIWASWNPDDWVIVDCGARRRGLSASAIRSRIAAKWGPRAAIVLRDYISRVTRNVTGHECPRGGNR